MTKFEEAQAKLDAYQDIYEAIQQLNKNIHHVYVETDEVKQASHYNWETKERELLWEDNEKTIPLMEKIKDWKDVPTKSLEENAQLKVKVYENTMKYIENKLPKY